ncbi:hypothetical protein ABIA69_002711 [Lysinibacillus parviboronicapiens]|uniref:IS3 family transposase n=1 Tax=Lysinibacillus parviboronicapiens TaxID=436516 RepID=A0ABV2PLJ1_9BACI
MVEFIKVADIPRSTYYYWEKRLNRTDKYTDVKAEFSPFIMNAKDVMVIVGLPKN